ncbi:MAG TPA: NAD(P)-dependent oxidoreductase [Gemmatimonadales bacterium]|nr:NAD(P)-dependent oxidoreductase [Gemmatimonadales bacterium]
MSPARQDAIDERLKREVYSSRVGFLGLGAIGAPMAAHLAKRHSLTVWNRTAARATEFATTHGARAVATPREAAAGAEVVLTCLPTSRDVAQLLDGPDGLEAGLGRGSLLIDCTSGDPRTSRDIAQRLARSGVAFVDAPVSGGVSGAEAGTLTVMVGGDEAAFVRAQPVLAAFGKRIEHLGPVGAGHAMKAVNNALLAVNLIAVGEGLAALVKAGVPARTAVEVLNSSSGRSFVSEALVPERVLTGRWPQSFRLALLDKDVGIARAFLRDVGVEGPILELAGQLLSQARAELGEAADHVEAIRLIERRAGVEIRG